MSTLKADAVTSAQDNTALTLSGTGTGGVKVNDFFVQTKGADIASGTTLTLGKDGNQFDVTGTTTITGIATQGIGSYVTLHFDGILTFTHHSTNLILPGAANITTAAGDIAVMYEYASADWRCVSYTKADGTGVVAAGGAWNLIGTAVASGSGTLDITGLSSTYDTYAIGLSDLVPATDNVAPYIRLGDSSGVDSAGSDYSWCQIGMRNNSSSVLGAVDAADSEIELTPVSGNIGNGAGDGLGGLLFLHTPGDATGWPRLSGTTYGGDDSGPIGVFSTIGGERRAVIVVDRIQFLFSSGNVATGRMTVWGVAHA